MDKKINFEVINSFAKEKYGGNPAGVVHYERDQLSPQNMQKIAKQLNLVETVFICRSIDDNYNFVMILIIIVMTYIQETFAQEMESRTLPVALDLVHC